MSTWAVVIDAAQALGLGLTVAVIIVQHRRIVLLERSSRTSRSAEVDELLRHVPADAVVTTMGYQRWTIHPPAHRTPAVVERYDDDGLW